jgi:two-component system, NarL family, nitrate/nitrite response regulator NarL
MGDKIRVAIVDDHPMVREGVAHVIAAEAGFEVVAKGGTAHDALEIVQMHNPDILVLDVSIPGGGIPALQSIVKLGKNSKVLMLTVSDDEDDVMNALNFGAQGYVLKGISGPELIQALRAVYIDGHYLSPSLGAKMLTNISRHKIVSAAENQLKLTEREESVLKLVKLGKTNKEIGVALTLSEKTVKHYMGNLFKKLNVNSRTELAIKKL